MRTVPSVVVALLVLSASARGGAKPSRGHAQKSELAENVEKSLRNYLERNKAKRDEPSERARYAKAMMMFVPDYSKQQCSWCSCSCHQGQKVQRSVSETNGCGPSWMPSFLTSQANMYDFPDCCNEHDRCYGYCDKTHDGCDKDFLFCMVAKCAGLQTAEQLVCLGFANEFHSAVNGVLGCIAYKGAQIDNCHCE